MVDTRSLPSLVCELHCGVAPDHPSLDLDRCSYIASIIITMPRN